MKPTLSLITFITGHSSIGMTTATMEMLRSNPEIHRIAVERPMRIGMNQTREGMAIQPLPEVIFVREQLDVLYYPTSFIMDLRPLEDSQLEDMYRQATSGIVVAPSSAIQ